MKARLKNGETIRISDQCRIILGHCDCHGNPVEVDWNEVSQIVDDNGIPLGLPNPLVGGMILSSNIDWEQRRYEIAKEMLPITCDRKKPYWYKIREEEVVAAVAYADALIAELKK